MSIMQKLFDDPIDRYFSKYRHQYDRERTKLETELYWQAAARNISPVTMSEHRSGRYIVIDNHTLARCIIGGVPTDSENGYPEEMNDDMITRLIDISAGGSRISYSLKLNPVNSGRARGDIQQAMYITQMNAEEKMADVQKNKGVTLQDMDTKIAQRHNESNYEDVVENKHKTFDSSFIITIWASTVEELNAIEASITLILESTGVKYEIPDYNHLETYLGAQPLNTKFKKGTVRILSPYAAVITSIRNPNSQTDNKGLWFGIDKITKKNIIFDTDKIIAPHFLVVGPTGSGKTVAVLAYLMRLFALGNRIILIAPKEDPDTNHRALTNYYGKDLATLVDIGPNENNINPLQIIYDRDVMNDDIDEYTYAFNMHKEIVIRFLQTWFDETGSVNMTGLLDSTLNTLYTNAKIYRNIPSSWHNANWPLMADLIELLNLKLKSGKLDADDRKTLKAILNKTVSFSTDGMLGYMNKPTTVDFSKDFIIFDMSQIPPMIKPAMNILVTAICGQRFRKNRDKKTIIAVDEAGIFLRNEDLTEFLLQSLTLGRSAKVSLWAITQQPTDLTKANVAEEFITNTFVKLILGNNMLPENIKIVQDHFKLNEFITEELLTSSVGDGALIVGKQHIPIHVQLTQLELDIMNDKLNPNSKNHVIENEPTIIPELKNFVMFHSFCLDSWANNFNLPGWKRERVQSAVLGSGLITAWIKEDILNPNGTVLNQSLDHYSTVLQIAAYILQKGITNIEVNHHTDADITFSLSDDEDAKHNYAIEFELEGTHTEKELQDKRHRLYEKYDNVYFVCHARYEKKLGSYIGEKYVFARGTQLKNLLDLII